METERVARGASAPTAWVLLLGSPRWTLDDAAGGEIHPLSRKDAALFALVALDGELPRERAAAWLWPDAPPRVALASLRQRLFRLRRAAGRALIEAGTSLRLAPGVRVDAADNPVPLDGELLGGFDYGDCDALDAWMGVARERLRSRRLDRRAGEAALLEASGALAAAIALCEQLVSEYPPSEHVWRRLMRLHYLRGDRAAAIDAFERFERMVCRELGITPAAETLALLDTIERMQSSPLRHPGMLPPELQRPPRLVGRAAALEALALAWNSKRAALVIGEGGTGKSRLLEDFVGQRPGMLVAHARPGDAAMPYATVTQLLALALERFAPELPAPARAELARLLPGLGDVPRGEASQRTLWQAVENALVRSVAHGLGGIVVDDLHHADAASLELLRWLAASPELRGLRMVFATRPAETPAAAAVTGWLGDSLRIEPVRLDALAVADVRELVGSLQLDRELGPPGPLADALYRHAGGHPFFTLETLKALYLSGSRPQGPLPLPAAAGALIERRVERLSAPARELLRLVALSGEQLRLGTAARVLGQPLADLALAWRELQEAQLAQGSTIAHDLVRECVLTRLPAAARSAVHLALAQALQHEPGVEPIRLARHWREAGCWREAHGALRAAAQRARIAGRLEEYEVLLRDAADAATRAGDETAGFDATCLALSVRMLRHGADEVVGALDEMLASAGTIAQRARLAAMRCEAFLNLGRVADALAAGTEAVALALPDTAERFEADVLHGRALALSGRLDEAIELLERARAAAPRFDDPLRALQATAALAHAHFAGNRQGRALVVQREAVALAARLGDATEIAHNTANLASVAINAGATSMAYAAAADARQRFAAMGMDDGHRTVNATCLARAAAHLGRFDEALAALDEVAANPSAHVGPTIRAMTTLARASLRLWLGEGALAASTLATLDAADLPGLLPVTQASALVLRLRLGEASGHAPDATRAALGQLATAHPALRQNGLLYREWSRFEPPADAAARLLELAAALHDSGASGAARSLEVAAVGRLQAIDAPVAAARARRLVAELPAGMMASTYPPEAWWTLARALRATDPVAAESCRGHARAWIDAARLPDPAPAAIAAFRRNNGVNRAVLDGDWADAGW